jgi:hypothetical protein
VIIYLQSSNVLKINFLLYVPKTISLNSSEAAKHLILSAAKYSFG